MDFEFSEEQRELQGLAKKIFRELCPPEALQKIDEAAAAAGDSAPAGFIHDMLWKALADSELLGICLKEDVGGAGLGAVEMCLLLQQAGWVAAPLPLHCTLIASLVIDRFGSETQRQELLPPVTRGEAFLSLALSDTAEEPVVAERSSAGFHLKGARDLVPHAHRARRIIVPAQIDGELGWFLVDPKADGVTLERQVGTNEEVFGRLELDLTVGEAARLGAPDQAAELGRFALERARLGQYALALGLAGRALILTANYSVERKQFGKSIGAFQAVAQRAGDAYVDVEIMKVTLWRAAWMLDDGQPAEKELLVAGYWSAECAHRVLNAAQHIHGGMGFDRDYPLYRYFLNVRQLELTLGSATTHLADLGAILASTDG